MGIFSQIVTAIRGGATEVGEAIVDSQAMRILDQEIRDAGNELTRSKDALAGMMAQRKLASDKAKSLEQQILEYEGYAMQAMDKGDQALAMDIANKIAELEQDAASERSLAESYDASIATTRQSISSTESNLKRLKQQVDMVKATESAQRAQGAGGDLQARLQSAGITPSGNSGHSVLARLQSRQMKQLPSS